VSGSVHARLVGVRRGSYTVRPRRAVYLDARRTRRFDFTFGLALDFEVTLPLRFGLPVLFDSTRSGNWALPVSRFHSSNVSGEIFPCIRSSANFRRCALLLKGISRREWVFSVGLKAFDEPQEALALCCYP
jgi:hypothetical protein